MYALYAITGLALVISLIVNRQKTWQALKIAASRFINIAPRFLVMLILVSAVLFLIPDTIIANYLGIDNKYGAVLFGSVIGSVILMPGFIAFPLAGILLTKGVPYMVLSAFTTTLMMVGILTYPVESQYLGRKVTIIRNTISFFIALVIAAMTGLFFGEIF